MYLSKYPPQQVFGGGRHAPQSDFAPDEFPAAGPDKPQQASLVQRDGFHRFKCVVGRSWRLERPAKKQEYPADRVG